MPTVLLRPAPQHEPSDLTWLHFHCYLRRRDNRAAACFRGLAGDHRAGDGVYHEGRPLRPEHIQRQLHSSIVFTASYFSPRSYFLSSGGWKFGTTVITSKVPATKDEWIQIAFDRTRKFVAHAEGGRLPSRRGKSA